jgi:NitT/TauT family transport system substrate-binding protein
MKRLSLLFAVIVGILVTSLAYAQTGQLKHVRIGTSPGTCLAPAFVAYEKGFFRQEGLDAELVPQEFDVQKDALATGKIDAALGLLDKWLKPLEQGLDAKFTAGVHHGCIQLLVPANSRIKSVRDLRGKRIGVPVIGDGPTTWASRVLVSQRLNPRTDVSWRSFPQPELTLAMQRGEVDAISIADPFGELAVQHGQARVLVNQSKDPAWKNQYCCLVVINGRLAKRDPYTAAAITRALLNAALWVRDNPAEAAKIEVNGNYVPSKNVELITGLLKSYNYTPSVSGGYKAVLNSAKQCKIAGILDDSTDPTRLANAVFLRLPGLEKYK